MTQIHSRPMGAPRSHEVIKHMLRWGRIVAVLPLLIASSALAYAQSDGRFSGTVFDPSNAVVVNAIVTVKNERTGAVRTATTEAGGRYAVTGLAPSTYTLSVKVGNFT